MRGKERERFLRLKLKKKKDFKFWHGAELDVSEQSSRNGLLSEKVSRLKGIGDTWIKVIDLIVHK